MDLMQIAQHADDLDRAAAFYTDLLGSGPTGRFDPPGLLFFDIGGARLLLEKGAPSAVLYLGVTDIEAIIGRLRASGVTIESELQVIFRHEDSALGPVGTDEWHAFIRDSEGNLVGLVELRPA